MKQVSSPTGSRTHFKSGRGAAGLVFFGLLGASTPSNSQTTPSAEPAQVAEVKKYCTNIAVAASDARFAYQTDKLNDLEVRIKTRIQDLDVKEAEVRNWIDHRADIEKKAAEKLVGIYAKMKPETAATQISALDDEMAAAILGQLSPGKASAIFNEIVPERAGKLASIIAGAAPSADKKL